MSRSVHVTVCGDDREHILDSAEFDADWDDDGRLYIRWRGERYPLRCERVAALRPGEDDWIRRGDEMRPDDRFYIYYDD